MVQPAAEVQQPPAGSSKEPPARGGGARLTAGAVARARGWRGAGSVSGLVVAPAEDDKACNASPTVSQSDRKRGALEGHYRGIRGALEGLERH